MPTAVFRAPTLDDVTPGDTVTSLAIGYSQPITVLAIAEHDNDPRCVVVMYVSTTGMVHIRTIGRDTRVAPWEGVELDPYSEAEYARERADYDD